MAHEHEAEDTKFIEKQSDDDITDRVRRRTELEQASALIKPTCPECGSNEIVEWNNVQTRYPITEVASGGPLDRICPQDYGVAQVLWDTSEAHSEDPFQCRDCWHNFGDFEHMVADPIKRVLARGRAQEARFMEEHDGMSSAEYYGESGYSDAQDEAMRMREDKEADNG